MMIAYFKRRYEKRQAEKRRRYEEIEKRKMIDRYNANFHFILESFFKELKRLAENGESFSSLDIIIPIDIADRDLYGTFEKATEDLGFVSNSINGVSAYHCIGRRLTVPLPEKGKPKSIAQMMIWGSK